MPVFEESGLRITLPEETAFRFADMRAYGKLKGCQVSEMDFGWRNEEKGAVCLMEIKDYSAPGQSLSREQLTEHLIPKLVAKGRDCLLFLRAAWNGLSELAGALREELPSSCRVDQPVRLFFVLKRDSKLLAAELPMFLKDKLTADLRAYASILGIRASVILVDHEKAIRMKLPVSLPSS
jgi:hypothetical protein